MNREWRNVTMREAIEREIVGWLVFCIILSFFGGVLIGFYM